jgi:hypothetical protein
MPRLHSSGEFDHVIIRPDVPVEKTRRIVEQMIVHGRDLDGVGEQDPQDRIRRCLKVTAKHVLAHIELRSGCNVCCMKMQYLLQMRYELAGIYLLPAVAGKFKYPRFLMAQTEAHRRGVAERRHVHPT